MGVLMWYRSVFIRLHIAHHIFAEKLILFTGMTYFFLTSGQQQYYTAGTESSSLRLHLRTALCKINFQFFSEVVLSNNLELMQNE